MTVEGICRPIRDTWDRAMDRWFRLVPCLSDPARRSSLGLKLALVALHLVYAGILFLFEGDLIEKTKKEPWNTPLYLLLFFAILVQHFITSSTSPGIIDVMSAVNEKNALFQKASAVPKQPAASKNGSLVITVDGNQSGRNLVGSNTTPWSKLVMEMYPPGTSASLHGQSIVMTATNVFFNLIIIVFGLGHALVRVVIVDFGAVVYAKGDEYAAQIIEVNCQFVEALQDLFERHKAGVGHADPQLKIL